MTRILDCLVTYFGLDEQERPTYRRYFQYHIVAGPGPTTGSGVASITTLAIHDDFEDGSICQHFHMVEKGGPEAAIAKAIRYLDAYHSGDHVRKVQSDIRGLAVALPELPSADKQRIHGGRPAGAVPAQGGEPLPWLTSSSSR